MYNIRLSDKGVAAVGLEVLEFALSSLVLRVRILRPGTTVRIVSILVTVINKEIVETKTSFLAFKAVNTWKYNDFFIHNSNKSSGLSLF